jgi:ribosomal protein S18 acetylase RimI-like enzyme
MAASTVRPLSWQEGGLLASRLEELSPHFPSAEAFAAWRDSAVAGLIIGRTGFMGVWEHDSLVGGLLLEGSKAHRTVMAVLGTVSPEALVAAMAELQNRTSAITYAEETGPDWPALLAPLGFKTFSRQTFVQEQALVEFRELPETPLVVETWDDRHRDEVVKLLATANVGSLDGLFLTMPEWPTAEACARVLDALLAGQEGKFLPACSFTAREGDALRGVLLAVESAPQQALLFDLAVHPAARGQNLSRRLVHAMQRAMAAQGYTELLFLTMAENTPVQKLFRREEIVRYEESNGGYWIAEAT